MLINWHLLALVLNVIIREMISLLLLVWTYFVRSLVYRFIAFISFHLSGCGQVSVLFFFFLGFGFVTCYPRFVSLFIFNNICMFVVCLLRLAVRTYLGWMPLSITFLPVRKKNTLVKVKCIC